MEVYCRACLQEFEATELLQYSESKRRLYVYCTGLQVKRNDNFSFQLCKECFIYLKVACKFKKQCRSSDRKFKTFLALKNAGEIIDFQTYMRSIEEAFNLKTLTASRVSTPIYQKNADDDDNESTCTSIQNFMTDIQETLQEEDVLTTEDKLIREVIQEDADISDDSLDSHWLDDDNANDFGMDFSFPAIATPITSNEDRYNTPLRITTDEEDTCHYVHKDVILKSDKTITLQNIKDKGMTRNTEFSDDNYTECNKLAKSSILNDMPLLGDCDVAIDGIIDTNMAMANLENEFPIASVVKLNNEPVIPHEETAIKQINDSLIKFTDKFNSINDTSNSTNDNVIEDHNINFQKLSGILNDDNRIDDKSVINHPFSLDVGQLINYSEQNLEKSVETEEPEIDNELEQYITKVRSKKKQNNTKECTIDKNLNLALKNDGKQIFPLEQLLGSPQDHPSGSSTPLVHNILFGNITPMHIDTPQQEITESNKKPDVVDSFMNVKNLNKDKDDVSVRIFKGCIKSEQNTKFKRKHLINSTRHYKDKTGLKELRKFETDEICNPSDEPDRPKYKDMKRKIENEISEDHPPPTKNKILCDDINSQTPGTDDLDISITNLLDFDGNQSLDLNISLASDFLEEEQKESMSDDDIPESDNGDIMEQQDQQDVGEEIDKNVSKRDVSKSDGKDQTEDLFKKPLLPDDDKYNLNQRMCNICHKRFMTTRVLRLHFGKVHKLLLPKTPKDASRVCEKCGIVLVDSATYKKHMKIHEGPLKCPYCSVCFKAQPTLRRHIKTHANDNSKVKKPEEKPQKEQKTYVCIICDKEFKKSGNFNVHMKRHEKNFAYPCESCDKGFVRKYDRDQHMITNHSKELPFCCELCPKKFKDRYMLVGHMYKHMGIKKLACEHCDMQFDTNQQLKQHYRTCEMKAAAQR